MIYIMIYLQEWEMRRAMNRSRIRNTRGGGWAWVPGLLRWDCDFDRDFDDGGIRSRENFWLNCPVLPDSDQLYFNFHPPKKPPKYVSRLYLVFTNTTKIQIWHVQQWGLWLILSKCQIFGGTFSQLQTRSDFDLSWPRGMIVTMLSLILMITPICRCKKKMQWL